MNEQETTAIVVRDRAGPPGMPAMSIDEALQRRNSLVEFTKKIMEKDVDYGVIPGTGTKDNPGKPTLLKPGAEKLCAFFGLSPRFEDCGSVVAFERGFFHYSYRCVLYRHGEPVGEGIGSCNSHESKHRYRMESRKCPHCKKETIIKGKEEYGGGWLCFAKKGGCGAKFKDGDRDIEGQAVGRIENPDVADVVNTLQKMAQKRALVAAVLVTVGASQFYTQDIEDTGESPDGGTYVPERDPPPAQRPTPAASNGTTSGHEAKPKALFFETIMRWSGVKPEDGRAACESWRKACKVGSDLSKLTDPQYDQLTITAKSYIDAGTSFEEACAAPMEAA